MERTQTELIRTTLRGWGALCVADSLERPTNVQFTRSQIVNFLKPSIERLIAIPSDQKNTAKASQEMWNEYGGPSAFIQDLQPFVDQLESIPFGSLTQSQRELIALYDLASIDRPGRTVSHFIKPHKLMNRIQNTVMYDCNTVNASYNTPRTSEDWLMSASFVDEIQGKSMQDVAKNHAKIGMDEYLKHKQDNNVSTEDFMNLSRLFVEEVFPFSKINPVFKQHPIYLEFDKLILEAHENDRTTVLTQYYPFSEEFYETRQRESVATLLSIEYSLLFGAKTGDLASQCADVYALFTAIHPAPDGNNTIISALIDFALTRRTPPLKPLLAWNKINADKPTSELRKFANGYPEQLVEWFEQRLCESNPHIANFFKETYVY